MFFIWQNIWQTQPINPFLVLCHFPEKNPLLTVFFFLFLVSENKTLCHPASVDSLSTSAGTEDHVSMGGFAARKALQVVRNVEKVKQG
jgi:hypothetical protein